MFLICGLGNPGVNYNNTRHNVGFHLADNIISDFNLNKIKEDKIKLDHTFVIHDDLDLELSKVKIKQGGGNGGHNGLESIDQFIGENYFRIRIGIDHPGHKDLVSSYVLNKFSKSEEEIINKKIDKLVKNIELIFSDIPLFLTKISEQN
jgi:PTH1 family peptidyl-tRNA hydrolase